MSNFGGNALQCLAYNRPMVFFYGVIGIRHYEIGHQISVLQN